MDLSLRTISPNLKFLHCLSRFDFLKSALLDGLMLTDHKVEFAPTSDLNAYAELLREVRPLLELHLNKIGHPYNALSEERQRVIMAGIGSIRGSVPMLCLTEVPQGKVIGRHKFMFGSYGLVLSSGWVEQNCADRVVYVGHNSPASRQLYFCLTTMRILSLFADQQGQVLFENVSLKQALDLLVYIETRDHLGEAEWRIAGHHGFHGGKRETGKRLPVTLNDIEYVLVPSEDEVEEISKVIANLAVQQHVTNVPKVLEFPDTLPA